MISIYFLNNTFFFLKKKNCSKLLSITPKLFLLSKGLSNLSCSLFIAKMVHPLHLIFSSQKKTKKKGSVTDTNINVLLRRVDKDHDPWAMAKPYPNCDMEGATRKLLLQTRRGYAPLQPTPSLSSPRVSVRCEHVSN
jgi:hypothetical protein